MEEILQNKRSDSFPLGEGGVGAYAEIIIPLALPKNYTWLIPENMLDAVHPGCRVEVNLGKNKKLKLYEVQQVLDSSHVYPVINKLIQKKVCYVWEALKQSYSPKKEIYVLLNPEFNNEEKLSDLLNNWSRAPKQMELLLSYLHLIKT